MAEDNKTIIKKSLVTLAKNATPNVVKKSLNKIINELNLYLDNLNRIYDNIQSDAQKILGIYDSIDADELATSYGLYKKLSSYDKEITDILKDGYVLIDEIRTFFTGEKILYDIGFTYGNSENLYEMQLSMEEILSYTVATYNTRSKIDNLYKLRMSVTKGELVEKYNAVHQKINTVDDGSSTLWSSIARYIKGKAPINMGNAYEAYKVYVKMQNGYNKIPPAEFEAETFNNILEEVRKNIAASTKGGDLENIQIKFFGKSAPSLMTTSTVRKTLTDILNIFKNIQSGQGTEQIMQDVQKIFLKDHEIDNITGKIEEAGLIKAEEYARQTIQKISLSVT